MRWQLGWSFWLRADSQNLQFIEKDPAFVTAFFRLSDLYFFTNSYRWCCQICWIFSFRVQPVTYIVSLTEGEISEWRPLSLETSSTNWQRTTSHMSHSHLPKLRVKVVPSENTCPGVLLRIPAILLHGDTRNLTTEAMSSPNCPYLVTRVKDMC